jgi:hypothetical protein
MSNVPHPTDAPRPEGNLPVNPSSSVGSSVAPAVAPPIPTNDLSSDDIIRRFDLQSKMSGLLIEETESLRKTVSFQGVLLQDALNTSEENRRRCEELERAVKQANHLNNRCDCNSRTYHLS